MREICEEYFCPAIEAIVEHYELKPDVAGATLLAFGNSAPEIFISFFSVLLAESNMGLGTILGSGAFNAMFLVGTCSMVAKYLVEL